jgi:hypothetical protein
VMFHRVATLMLLKANVYLVDILALLLYG